MSAEPSRGCVKWDGRAACWTPDHAEASHGGGSSLPLFRSPGWKQPRAGTRAANPASTSCRLSPKRQHEVWFHAGAGENKLIQSNESNCGYHQLQPLGSTTVFHAGTIGSGPRLAAYARPVTDEQAEENRREVAGLVVRLSEGQGQEGTKQLALLLVEMVCANRYFFDILLLCISG